jgi:hypothetical protein
MSFVKNCRKVVCVGRNYAAHAKELNNAIRTSDAVCSCRSPLGDGICDMSDGNLTTQDFRMMRSP